MFIGMIVLPFTFQMVGYYVILMVLILYYKGSETLNGFGAYLKSQRRSKKLSQRELAEKIGLHFTYINKTENEALPPPSEEKLLLIEEVLQIEKYDLVLLAGKIPEDFKSVILLDADVQNYLRERVKVIR